MMDDNGGKWLPAARLVELLRSLPADFQCWPNQVGNLKLVSADGKYIGFVSFNGDGGVEIFSDEQDGA